MEVSTSNLSRVSPQQTSYQILHDYLKASLLVIMHELEGDGLRDWLSLASWLNNLEGPKVFPLKLGEGKHHDGRKWEIEQTSKLNETSEMSGNGIEGRNIGKTKLSECRLDDRDASLF